MCGYVFILFCALSSKQQWQDMIIRARDKITGPVYRICWSVFLYVLEYFPYRRTLILTFPVVADSKPLVKMKTHFVYHHWK